MDEKVIEKSENVVTKTTKAKTPRTKAKTRTVDNLSLSDRVSIDNLCGWTIGFVSEENGKSIQIDPNIKDYKRLTLAEIDSQVTYIINRCWNCCICKEPKLSDNITNFPK